jgi:hypothetical protein
MTSQEVQQSSNQVEINEKLLFKMNNTEEIKGRKRVINQQVEGLDLKMHFHHKLALKMSLCPLTLRTTRFLYPKSQPHR